MKTIGILITFLIWLCIGLQMQGETKIVKMDPLKKLIPGKIDGWTPDSTERYDKENLYQYINGGAELYISYNFKQVLAQPYIKKGEKEIRVDIFDMGDSYHAYGIFSHSREFEDRFVAKDIESEYGAGLLSFWRGRYYISILAYPETPEKKETVRKLAREIVKRIPDAGKKPDIVASLPEAGLITSSIRYFKNHVWLNSHLYISSENILKIAENTEAVIAKYQGKDKKGKKPMLLLVKYPDKKSAADAYRSFVLSYMPKHEKGAIKKGDHWIVTGIYINKIGIMFNVSEVAEGDQYLNKIKL